MTKAIRIENADTSSHTTDTDKQECWRKTYRDARAEGMRDAAKLCQLEVERYLTDPHCPHHAAGALGCARRIMEAAGEEGKDA